MHPAPARHPSAGRTTSRHGLRCAVLLALAGAASLGQASKPAPPLLVAPTIAVPTAPRFIVQQAATPVELKLYRQEVSIVGQAVMTRLTLQFHNPNARVLEGELQFPLQDGQTITGLALDIDGELRRAVPVNKAKGLQVFEEIVRGRVDPALLEATSGNQYKLRVYPLPAHGTRTVQLDLMQAMPPATPAAGRGPRATERVLRLAIGFDAPIARAELSVNVAGVARRALRATEQGLPAGSVQASDVGGATVLRMTPRPLARAASVVLRLPVAGISRAAAAHFDGQDFVYAELPVPGSAAVRPAPRRLALVWDASGSGALRRRAADFALLDALFARWPDLRVRLYVLRDRLEAPVDIEVRGGAWHTLRQRLEAEPFDGATQLGAVQLPADVADLALLFSDGQSTFGARELPAFGMPTFVLQSATGSQAAALRPLVEARGGAVLDLLAQRPEDAAARIGQELPRLVDLRSDAGDQWIAAAGSASDGRLAVAGIAQAPQGVLAARFALPGGGSTVQRVRWGSGAPATPRHGEPLVADGAPPLAAVRWATLQLDALAGRPELHRRRIEQLGQRFGLATSETSLIVLETLGDYVRHRIEPPAGPLRQAWRQQAAQFAQQERGQQQQRIEQLVQRFRERQTWWATDFPKDSPPPVRGEAPATGPAAGAVGSVRERADIPEALAENRTRKARQTPLPMTAPTTSAAPNVAPALGTEAPRRAVAAAPAPAERRALAADRDSAKREDAADGTGAATTAIALKPWAADTPAARRLRAAAARDRYAVYLDERAQQLRSPAFFLDAADLFFTQGDAALGLRVLSNLAEMELENRALLRILGYRLLQAQRADLAVPVFERVLEIAPHEPQSSRDLGLALADAQQWQSAAQQLWQTAIHASAAAGRFPDIDLTALAEMNALVAKAKRLGRPVDTAGMDPRLLTVMPLGLRVVLGWDADNTDIDLHVTDPDGQVAYYGQPRTRQGGRMSADFTGGYGPEEFALRRPKPGVYTVRAHFFGHRQQLLAPATSLMLRLSTGFGTAAEREQRVMLRLAGAGETVLVGEFRVEPLAD
jgi:Ca-activated chloride channel family protein